MMKYKYEFEADETFSKGCCFDCPFSYFDEHKTGSVMSRIINDLFGFGTENRL